MSEWESETCEECGFTGPVANDNLFARFNGEMLCATCRVDKRLAAEDFSSP